MLRNYAVAPLPLSHRAPELTSGKIQVVERRSGKIRGGGVALQCTPPYFDHWLLGVINVKNDPFYNNVYGPSFVTHIKRQILISSTQGPWI